MLTNLYFRFKGSSLSVQGHLVSDEGEWVVTGGTGEFAFAQGVVTYKKIKELPAGNIRELRFRVVCFNFPKPVRFIFPSIVFFHNLLNCGSLASSFVFLS